MIGDRRLLDLAIGAARRAGDSLRERGEAFSGVKSLQGRDVKLRADSAAEAMIINDLSAASDFPILSEETGWTQAPGATAWVVDPLDGSANYLRQIPLCSVSIALMHDGEPVLGVVYDFNHGELFAGMAGQGATLNGAPIHVSQTGEVSQSILMTGLALNRDFEGDAMAAFGRELSRWKKVRMFGTAATSIAQVAAGRADCYFEDAIMLWDVAAACAIAQAAGGSATISPGPLDAPKRVVVHNGSIDPWPTR